MPLEIDGAQFLTQAEVLDLCGITRQTLWRWRQEGKIPSGHRLRGRTVVFSSDEVQAIRDYALRIEPIDTSEAAQMALFDRKSGSRGR